MQTPFGHLTYCSNIHTGEDWQNHFAVLQENIPSIKAKVSPDAPMGIGLRLANLASIDLFDPRNLQILQSWLKENDCYIFTMNGFPYGGFHDVVVKDQVHAPDWTSDERVAYTIRMFHLLSKLLPNHLTEGGISTSPLSYRFWWKNETVLTEAIEKATKNMLTVVDELLLISKDTGKILHLDIEPEPDGILENSMEFIDWYQNTLIPMAIEHFAQKSISAEKAIDIIRTHIQLCYDICHFGVSYEEPQPAIDQLNALGIKVGKIQISSAIKVDFTSDAAAKLQAIAQYDEPTYLHQVVALRTDGKFDKFPDLKQAIDGFEDGKYNQWRVHFHVPLFLETYGLLSSTQSEIIKTLAIQKTKPFTNHLEIETYTWGVLPSEVQVPLNESIIREIAWVQRILK
ncbi:metabolite traffic protein EboE [Arcicella sp. LKC2W]|uniref:metabolite traffic protein EboE n=1 Tax=Arcicella sp. LKC2W TaxID=2984198 RepID=UPI002B1FFBFC|nr:metabolite traffic protein EboE [Arcicella sp. LKC2W]MEA5457402.1 metabolite traffic protein EboE [Arcicella sp. LKC2W]